MLLSSVLVRKTSRSVAQPAPGPFGEAGLFGEQGSTTISLDEHGAAIGNKDPRHSTPDQSGIRSSHALSSNVAMCTCRMYLVLTPNFSEYFVSSVVYTLSTFNSFAKGRSSESNRISRVS